MIEGKTPTGLVFDDDSLDGILYGKNTPKATPTDFFECWGKRELDDPELFERIISVLSKGPKLIKSCFNADLRKRILRKAEEILGMKKNRENAVLSLARLYAHAGDLEKAEALFREALAFRGGIDFHSYWEAMEDLGDVLEKMGRDRDAWEIKSICQAQRYIHNGDSESLITVRSLALDLFDEGMYASAEQLYRWLLEKEFQPPGTLIHLSRVLILQNRFTEADQAVEKALESSRIRETRQTTPGYVIQRILFCRALFLMLAGEDGTKPVAALRKELCENKDRCVWKIEPVLEHIREHLAPDDLALLKAIADRINGMAPLDAIPEQYQSS